VRCNSSDYKYVVFTCNNLHAKVSWCWSLSNNPEREFGNSFCHYDFVYYATEVEVAWHDMDCSKHCRSNLDPNYRFYTIGKNMMEGDVRYPADFRGPPSFNVGLYLIIAGYVIVVAGSIWDIVQKRKQIQNKPAVTLPTKKEINIELRTTPTTTQDEPTDRLKKLKDMLDQELISREDYESKKAEILSKL
jgi:hypothetical protein